MSMLGVSVSGFHNHHFSSSNLNAATISSWKPVVAVLSNKNKLRVSFELKKGQSRIFHKLLSGLSMVRGSYRKGEADDDDEAQ
ncbi:hypothetical protein HN51_003108, partial [Arachis hypogaea]